jgi:DNA-nicking Smr family endonuclease
MTRGDFERWLERYPPPADLQKERPRADGVPSAPRNLPVERSIDLHGLTALEAHNVLDDFVRRAAREGVRKILIIHGKGSHPGSEGALRKLVARYLDASPMIGATGHPGASEGGSGATWAMVRQRSR